MHGILLINLGTPNSPKPKDVFRYLNEFLTDKHVIDLPYVARQLLVRGVIVPKRYKTSAKNYQTIWTEEGSPLLVHTKKLQKELGKILGEDFAVEIGMRYQNPSISKALDNLRKMHPEKITIIPLFPQYATATTGSICDLILSKLKTWKPLPELKLVTRFYNHPTMIKAFASIAASYDISSYDHVLISFHGLPEKALKKDDIQGKCLTCSHCCHTLSSSNKHCYGAQCYATAKALAKSLSLERYTVCFQSRLGKEPWLQPFTSDCILSLAKQGCKRLLVISPAFVADCLETLHEIAIEYKEEFLRHGGEELTLVESLNAHPLWVQTLKELITEPVSPHF